MRYATEEAATTALASGCSAKVGAAWSHEPIKLDALKAALSELEAFPKMSDTGKMLARCVRLLKCPS